MTIPSHEKLIERQDGEAYADLVEDLAVHLASNARQIWEELEDHGSDGDNRTTYRRLAKRRLLELLALRPAVGEREPVVIKPLEWSEYWLGSNEDIPAWRGTSPFGWSTTISFAHDHSVQKHADADPAKLAEAKAAAQADYEQRIRSALASPHTVETAPVADGRASAELMKLGHAVLDLALPSSMGNSTDFRVAYNSGIAAAAKLIREHSEAASPIQGMEPGGEWQLEQAQDKIDGLEADIDSAVEVAWNRGAIEWTRRNYPKHYAKFMGLDPRSAGTAIDLLTGDQGQPDTEPAAPLQGEKP